MNYKKTNTYVLRNSMLYYENKGSNYKGGIKKNINIGK